MTEELKTWKVGDKNPTIDRFFKKLKIRKNNGCWIWIGSRTASDKQKAYGQFAINGKVITAHRASWIIFKGKINPSMDICHKCDARLCVKPDHLFQGTRSENMIDSSMKGRIFHKFNSDEAAVIRCLPINFPRKRLAAALKIPYWAITNIRMGVAWKHSI